MNLQLSPGNNTARELKNISKYMHAYFNKYASKLLKMNGTNAVNLNIMPVSKRNRNEYSWNLYATLLVCLSTNCSDCDSDVYYLLASFENIISA